MELTPRQADVMLVIRNHKHLKGHSPSIREIAKALNISRGTVMCHLDRMEKKGLIQRTFNTHRTLEVTADIQGLAPKEVKRPKKKTVQEQLDEWRNTG